MKAFAVDTSKFVGIGLENEQIGHIHVMLLDRGLLEPGIEFLYGPDTRGTGDVGKLNEEGDAPVCRLDKDNGLP